MSLLRTKHEPIARLCAVLVLALGGLTLLGWSRHWSGFLQWTEDSPPLVFNTALALALAGLALLAAGISRRWSSAITTLLVLLLAALALEELVVMALDLSPALSQPELHRSLQADQGRPGRMAAITALGLLVYAVGLVALARPDSARLNAWGQRAGVAVMALGLAGMLGYSLRLEYLYGWSAMSRMSVQTGAALFTLGIGLWHLAATRLAAQPVSDGEEVAGVNRTAGLLLLLVATAAGFGGFVFLQHEMESQVRSDLARLSADRITLLGQLIRERSVRAALLSDNFDLARNLRALRAAPDDPEALAALRVRAGALKGSGFSSVQAEAGGRRWQLAGRPGRSALVVALAGEYPGRLLWQDGYVLQRALAVSDDAGVIGALVTEQRLPPLDPTGATAARFGATGEAALCAAAGVEQMDCFPLRSLARPSRLGRQVNGQRRPMDRALRGDTGIVTATDYRQHRVLAAYGPVQDTGLGVVVKKDVAEIYAPIRREFERIALFLALLLGLGMWVMRRRLRPLLRRLENTRAQARASGARFEAAMESNLDAFFLFECQRDADGRLQDLRYVLLNARGEQTLQRPRAEIIGHGMCELYPELRDDGMLADFQHVVETGQPLVRVRQSVVRDKRWLHMQIVPVGDGVGLTVRDVTAERLSADKLRHQALHDPLTGLANRVGFELALTAAMAEAGRTGAAAAVALLDLDGFKQVNDSLGHGAGDRLLQEVATRLRDAVRPSDTVARLGGDEFALVLTAIHYPAGAKVVAAKLVALLAQPMLIDGHPVSVTVSIGVCQFPHDGANAAALLRCADAAMYRSKRAGRNGFTLHSADLPLPG